VLIETSFDQIPAAEQFERWSHTISQTYVPLTATPANGDTAFGGDLITQSLGPAHLSEISGGSCEVARTIPTIRQSDPGMLKLSLQLRGQCLLRQDGRETNLAPGDLALYDTRQPYQLHLSSGFTSLILMFPRTLFPLTDNELREFAARRVSGRRRVGGLVGTLLLNMSTQMRARQLTDQFEVADAVLTLLAAAVSEQLGSAATARSVAHHNALMIQVKGFTDARLHDPDLSASRIAAANNVSLRYLQKLFAKEGTTVTDWLRTRRLERCRCDLLNPRHAGVPIAAIAARWGLVDPSSFSRMFKAAYGTGPRAFRADMLNMSGFGRLAESAAPQRT
jgi:AraC-like DNA-binding protein